jgi:hypothetical protein
MAVDLLSVSRAAAPKRAAAEESAPAPVEAAPQYSPEPSYAPASEYESAPPVAAVEPAAEAAPEPSYEPEASYQPEPSYQPEASFSGADTIQTYDSEPATGSMMDSGVAEEATTPSNFAPEASDVAVDEPEMWTATPVEEPAAAPPRRRFGHDQELPVEVHGDEERRLHNDARRFARLLISEIKLYNEQKVAEGRDQHDLYDRLREYIDRSREMYDKRVKAEVASRYDYFHGELVNTLAEGDVSKLGSNYPGATVNA